MLKLRVRTVHPLTGHVLVRDGGVGVQTKSPSASTRPTTESSYL